MKLICEKQLVVSALFLISISSSVYALEGAVKVECWYNCDNVTLGQACDSFYAGSKPIAIACDDSADPGRGTQSRCGNGFCTPYGALVRTDLVGAYCKDGGGNDAIVTCATASTLSSNSSTVGNRGAMEDVENETAVQKYTNSQQP